MEVLAIELEKKREDLQWIQVLVPIRHMSLDRNVCSLRHRCPRAVHSNEEFPLQEKIFLDTWGINSAMDYPNYQKPSRHQGIVKDELVTWTSTGCSGNSTGGLPWDSAI